MDLSNRAVYWALVVGLSMVVALSARTVVDELIAPERIVASSFAIALANASIFTPILYLLTRWMATSEFPAIPTLARMYGVVFMVTILVTAVRRTWPRMGRLYLAIERPQARPVQGQTRPRLLERLPKKTVGAILRLTVRDHFVDVVTSHEVVTLRMRFRDAINEMEPVPGYCAHRSHWVAHDAVKHPLREPGGKIFLKLVNGDKVPVSRKYRPRLEEAGLL